MARRGAMARYFAHLGWIAAAALAIFFYASCDRGPAPNARTIEPRLSRKTVWVPFRPQRRGSRATNESPAAPVTLAESNIDPRAWSDLSAALHENAIRHDAPELLAD